MCIFWLCVRRRRQIHNIKKNARWSVYFGVAPKQRQKTWKVQKQSCVLVPRFLMCWHPVCSILYSINRNSLFDHHISLHRFRRGENFKHPTFQLKLQCSAVANCRYISSVSCHHSVDVSLLDNLWQWIVA